MRLISPSLDQLVELDQACFPDPYAVSTWQGYLGQPARFVVIAFENRDALVGYACFSVLEPEAELLRVGVLPSARSKGIARSGLNLCHEFLLTQDIFRVMLEVRESNIAARALYQRLGYIQDGVRRSYYAQTPTQPLENAILMSLILSTSKT